MASESKVGQRVKTYRENLKMTLADLAAKSGVSVAVIASIEDGEVMPALGVLTKLSRALGQRLGTFMDDQFKPDPIITRASDLESVKVAHNGETKEGYAYYSLAIGKPDRHMDPFKIDLAPNVAQSLSSHEGLHLRRGGDRLRHRDHDPAGWRHRVLQQRGEALRPRGRRQARLDLRHRVHAVLIRRARRASRPCRRRWRA